MSSDFVRYSSEIETFDPQLSEYMIRIIDFWEKKVRASPTTEGTGRACRGAHAKTIGVARAEVEILDGAPAPYAQGIYATPGRHDALIRFSSAANHLGPDAQLGPVLGFAIKIFDIPGTKLVEDEPDATTFDYVLKNNPTFIANTAKHYLFIQEIGDQVGTYLERGKPGFRDLLNDYLTGKGTLEQEDWAWEELFAFVKTATQTPVRNPLLNPYWTMAAVRHGDYVAKVRVAPAVDSAERRSTTTSTSAAVRTCSVRPWRTNCRHTSSISTSRFSCARISPRCRSTTRPWNGRRSSRLISPSGGCTSRARTSPVRRTSRTVMPSRSTNGE